LTALKRYWGRVEFIAFPIGHVGTTLTKTQDQLTAAFSTVCQRRDPEPARAPLAPPRTLMLGPTTTTCSRRYWTHSRT
jgi:hypothetical protein